MRQNEPSLWPLSFPAQDCNSPSEPCPSPLQVQSSSPSASSPFYTVCPSPLLTSHPLSHSHLLRPLPLPLWSLRQRPLQQATAKGWGQPPPHLGLWNPLRPHNMGSSPPSLVHAFHSFPIQHLVVDIVRLYIAYHKSETDDGADLYYLRVTSMTSIMKTSIYLGETVVSDLFIVRTYPPSPFVYHQSCHTSSYIGAISYGTRASP